MASAMKKMFNYLGLTEDEGVEVATPHERVETSSKHKQSPIKTLKIAPERVATPEPAGAIEKIVSIAPRVYSDVRSIGEFYRDGNPVIMNLSNMDESERKRLIDFASGLVFGHSGKIERVTNLVFLLTPPNVMVSNDEKSAAAEASFFNQS